jgi:hypothetical protein
MVTGKDESVKRRFIDHIISASASALVLFFVGWLAGYTELKADVLSMKNNFTTHEKQNAQYREDQAKAREKDDKKWDDRITRIENCFIIRNCGK